MIIGPTSGNSISRGSVRRTATTSCRRFSRLSDRSQPGTLMKSEMMKSSEQRRQVRERCVRQPWLVQQVVNEAQDLVAPAAGRDRPSADAGAAIEDRPDSVAAPGQYPGQRGHEVNEDGSLVALRGRSSEVDRWTQIQQEPGRYLPLLDVLANVWRVHSRGDVPIDGPHVILGLVFAQVHEIDAVAPE